MSSRQSHEYPGSLLLAAPRTNPPLLVRLAESDLPLAETHWVSQQVPEDREMEGMV